MRKIQLGREKGLSCRFDRCEGEEPGNMCLEHLSDLQESSYPRVELEAETVGYVGDCSGRNVQAKSVARGSANANCGLSWRGEPHSALQTSPEFFLKRIQEAPIRGRLRGCSQTLGRENRR